MAVASPLRNVVMVAFALGGCVSEGHPEYRASLVALDVVDHIKHGPAATNEPGDPEVGEVAEKGPELHKVGCADNVAEDCNSLAIDYEKGRGVPVDYLKAFTAYTKACDAKLATACTNRASLYEDSKATAAIENACGNGRLRGCNQLGVDYGEGHYGITVSPSKAAPLFEKACDGGEMAACTNYAIALRDEEGVRSDFAKSLELFQKSCGGGDARGCTGLGWAYDHGFGTPKEHPLADNYYGKGCEGGDGGGCVDLGVMCEEGDGVPMNLSKATALYEKACTLGSYVGCANAGLMYRDGRGVTKNTSKAKALIKKGCDGKNTDACAYLVSMS